MPSETAFAPLPDGWQPLAALLASDGSGESAALARLSGLRAPLRDIADALHCLCLLHGHHPGPVDIALDRAVAPQARDWLAAAAEGFSGERDWLSRLVAAVGPMPSTANQTATESAIATQRHAIEMLATSDRRGCALGAAAALVMDWHDIRGLLDRTGERLGLTPPASALPTLAASRELLRTAPVAPEQARAFHFGAQQMLAQQRGLWSLIDARAEARALS